MIELARGSNWSWKSQTNKVQNNVAELAYVQGKLDEHLVYTKALGWEATEISETYVTYPAEIKRDLINRCVADGLDVFYEWGLKRPEKPLDPEEAAEDIRDYLDTGVSIALIEEGEIEKTAGHLALPGLLVCLLRWANQRKKRADSQSALFSCCPFIFA